MKRFSVVGAVCIVIFSAVFGYFFLKHDLKKASVEKQTVQSTAKIEETKSVASKGAQLKIQEKQKDSSESDNLNNKSKILKNNIIPEFDVVRVEKSGEALFAGRALAGSKIVIELNGKEIAQTEADDTGAFVALPAAPLSGESNQIIIRSIGLDGSETVSKQVVAIGVTGDSEPLVALAEPGKAINVLQKPEVQLAQNDVKGAPESVSNVESNKEAVRGDAVLEGIKSPSVTELAENSNQEITDASEQDEQVVSLDALDDIEDNKNAEQSTDTSLNNSLENINLNNNKQEVKNDFEGDDLNEEKKRVARLVVEDSLDVEQISQDSSSGLQSNEALPDVSNEELNVVDVSPNSDDTAKVSKEALVTKNVSVEAIEVDDEKLFIAGEGVKGQSVRVYIDEKPVGDIEVKENGRWLLEKTEELKPGEYKVRVDQLNQKDASVTARAEVPFVVEEKTQAEIDLAGGGSIIIRRDDNLWTIAQRVYGSGIRYTAIYEQNRDQIRDPDLIFPGQIFNLPKLEKKPTSSNSE